jgi:hypothetical protein
MRTRCDSNKPVGADLLHEPGGRPFVCCCALTHLHTDTERATYSEIFGWCLTRQARWPPFLSAAVRSHTCARTSPKQSLREVIGRWVQSSLAFMRACKCSTEQARWPGGRPSCPAAVRSHTHKRLGLRDKHADTQAVGARKVVQQLQSPTEQLTSTAWQPAALATATPTKVSSSRTPPLRRFVSVEHIPCIAQPFIFPRTSKQPHTKANLHHDGLAAAGKVVQQA